MTSIDFSIVVPTRNRPSALRRLLDAAACQQYSKERYEVVVVDDGGDTPIVNLEEEYRDRMQLFVIRQAHAGCGPARQAGTEHSRGRYLVFTDDDCRPEPGYLARLAEIFELHPACGVGGRTMNGLESNILAETSQFIVGLLTTYDCDNSGRARFCPTSNSAFPVEQFRALGGFDLSWQNSGGEDRDLCARWLNAGYTLRYEPSVVVWHFHQLSVPQFIRQHVGYGRGAQRFHRGETNRFEPAGFYRDLVTRPFREYPTVKALRIAGAVALAEAATAVGFVLESLSGMTHRLNYGLGRARRFKQSVKSPEERNS